jgi:4-diphosphocytidyl-2C-methyl-D-erythritol kinase
VRHLADAVRFAEVSSVAAHLYNNMTDASCGLVEGIAQAIAWSSEMPRVLGVAMAGSGSGVFSICADADAAASVAAAARDRGWWAAATSTRANGVTVSET